MKRKTMIYYLQLTFVCNKFWEFWTQPLLFLLQRCNPMCIMQSFYLFPLLNVLTTKQHKPMMI